MAPINSSTVHTVMAWNSTPNTISDAPALPGAAAKMVS